MTPALGAHVNVRFEDLIIECWVKDVKNSYGKPRLLIVPVVGSGEQWVELGRVTIPASTPRTVGEATRDGVKKLVGGALLNAAI
jgi:2-keto-3-deoxy-galactonokinase